MNSCLRSLTLRENHRWFALSGMPKDVVVASYAGRVHIEWDAQAPRARREPKIELHGVADRLGGNR
jgi:hypothetical protein